jgi:hypothetical protein
MLTALRGMSNAGVLPGERSSMFVPTSSNNEKAGTDEGDGFALRPGDPATLAGVPRSLSCSFCNIAAA